MEVCRNCDYTVPDRTAKCPYCGYRLTHPLWKKAGAWVLLVLIGYGFVRCNLQFMQGLDKF